MANHSRNGQVGAPAPIESLEPMPAAVRRNGTLALPGPVRFVALSPSLDMALVIHQEDYAHFAELVELESATVLWRDRCYGPDGMPPCVFVSNDEFAMPGTREVKFYSRARTPSPGVSLTRTVQGWDPTPSPWGEIVTLGTRERSFDEYAGRGYTRDGDDLDEPFSFKIFRDRAKIGDRIVQLHATPTKAWWMGPNVVLFGFEHGELAVCVDGVVQRLALVNARVAVPTSARPAPDGPDAAGNSSRTAPSAVAMLLTATGATCLYLRHGELRQEEVPCCEPRISDAHTRWTQAAACSSGLYAVAGAAGRIVLGRCGAQERHSAPPFALSVSALAVGEAIRGRARLVGGTAAGLEWVDLELT